MNDIPDSTLSKMPEKKYQIMISPKDSESILQDESFWNDISLLFHSRIKSLSRNLINVTNTTHGQLKEISNNLNPLITEIEKKLSPSQTVSNHHSSTGIVMNPQIEKRIEDDPQFGKIFNGLYDRLPDPLIGIIGDYVPYHYDKTITGFLKRIMRDLGVSEEERNSLDLYFPSFASWLLKRLKEKKEEIPPLHELWFDLDRFIFKWLLAMKRILADDDQAFEELAPNIDPIIATIHKDGFDWDDESVSTLASIKSNFSAFELLIRHESIDNPDILRYFINHVIKDVYDDHNHRILKIDCQQLLNRHFDGQSFNSNPLLKMMLIYLTPEEISKQISKNCFPKEESSYLYNYHGFTINIQEIYTQQDYSPKDIDWIQDINGSYSSSKMIEFLLDNKLGFRIYDSFNLINLLRRLERLKLLQEISLDIIIKFKIESEKDAYGWNIWRWDISTFEKYLKDERDEYNPHNGYGISPAEYKNYNDLIEKYKIIQINNISI
jgi:hypothetical protein